MEWVDAHGIANRRRRSLGSLHCRADWSVDLPTLLDLNRINVGQRV
jgi:hypothetical protein